MAEVGPFGFNDRFGCEGEGEGERGERGKRGHRGERGHRGPAGSSGPTGPTGPSGPGSGSGVLLGRQVFDAAFTGVYTPTPGTTFAIVRGAGGGGGGGGVGVVTAPGDAAGASGGNSGIGIEVSVGTLGGILLTGGPITGGDGTDGLWIVEEYA